MIMMIMVVMIMIIMVVMIMMMMMTRAKLVDPVVTSQTGGASLS